MTRWRRTVLDEMQQRIVQMGLSACPVCSGGQLFVLKYPVFLNVGGIHREPEDPRWDPESNVVFLVHVGCDSCGHVLLFDSERLMPAETKALIQGLTEEEGD